MLRELVDIALLEDFVRGLARSTGLRVCTFDAHGGLVTASDAVHEFTRLTHRAPAELPPNPRMTPVPAHDPPGHVAFIHDAGVWYVVAPVYLDEQRAGYVGAGEFREQSLSGEQWKQAQSQAGCELPVMIQAWEKLPALDRTGNAHPIVTVRWGARLLAEWCRRETRLLAAAEEVTLVGDIAELLTGEQDLQRILDRIVANTARAMQCRFCSLRLYNPETGELAPRAVHNLSERYLNKGPIRVRDQSIDAEALKGNVVYVEDAVSDPRVQYPEEARREGIISMLTAGMIYRHQPVGVIRVYTDRKQRFRRMQRNLLRAVADQAAIAVVHAQLVDERLRAAETRRQLALAADVQARMVRRPPPDRPGLETALVYQPSFQVGGDFCDFLTLGDGRLLIAVGDVAGKGIPAALVMASIRGALRAIAESTSDLGEILTRLNRHVCCETAPHEFATLILTAIDPDLARGSYCNAGHEPLLLLRHGVEIEHAEGGLVLGLSESERYEQFGLSMRPGDFLLLYTDGAIDAMNFAGETFGRERLRTALRQSRGGRPADVLQSVVWDIRRFSGLAEQSDDLTLVGVRVPPLP